jgi:hypothetical protein
MPRSECSTEIASNIVAEVYDFCIREGEFVRDYHTLTAEDFRKYLFPVLKECLMTMDDFREEVYDSIKYHAGEPYCFYVDIGAYIADELRTDNTYFRKRDGKWTTLCKWDLRAFSCGEYQTMTESTDDVYVVKDHDVWSKILELKDGEESEEESEDAEPDDLPSPRESFREDMEEWVAWVLSHNYCGDYQNLKEFPPDCPPNFHQLLQYEIDMWMERQVDIARGK